MTGESPPAAPREPSTRQPSSDLLSIDVEAEIRKLCSEQLPSAGDRLVELVRLMIGRGARRVRVRLGLRFATVDAIGAALPREALGLLAAIADPRLAATDRHAALARCEAEYGVALLSLAGVPAVDLAAGAGGERWALHLRAGEPPSLTPLSAPGTGRGDEPASPDRLRMRMSRQGSRREQRAALARACRYSGVPILVDGCVVSLGLALEDVVFEVLVAGEAWQCKVGLPRAGEVCHTIVLCNEIICSETYGLSPTGQVHSALVRCLGVSKVEPAELAGLRRVVRVTRDQLYRRLASDLSRVPRGSEMAARSLLLRWAERRQDASVLAGVPLFRRLDGARFDLAGIQAAAAGGVLWAIDPARSPRRGRGCPVDVFVLGARERDFLRVHAGVLTQEPAWLSRPSLRARGRRLLERAGRRGALGVRRVAGMLLGGRLVRPAELEDAELRFISALQAMITSGQFLVPGVPVGLSPRVRVYMAQRGALPLQVRGHGDDLCVLIPRRHPRVPAMVEALARDPASILPVTMALFGGHDGFGPRKVALQEALLLSGMR